MEKYELSGIEQELYDYIKEKGEVTLDAIKKDLGDKYLGAIGKLIRKELVEKGKRRTGKANQYGFGVVLEKIIKIKGAKEMDLEGIRVNGKSYPILVSPLQDGKYTLLAVDPKTTDPVVSLDVKRTEIENIGGILKARKELIRKIKVKEVK